MRRFLILVCALAIFVSLVGCSCGGEKEDAAAAGEELMSVESLKDCQELVDKVLKLEKEYDLYLVNDTNVIYKQKREKQAESDFKNEVTLGGKITLPAAYADVAQALSLECEEAEKETVAISGGTKLGKTAKLSDGTELRIALYSDKSCLPKEADVVGISLYALGKEKAPEFSLLGGIDNNTTLKGAQKLLGNPKYINITKVDEKYTIAFQYSGKENAILTFGSASGKLEEVVAEFN